MNSVALFVLRNQMTERPVCFRKSELRIARAPTFGCSAKQQRRPAEFSFQRNFPDAERFAVGQRSIHLGLNRKLEQKLTWEDIRKCPKAKGQIVRKVASGKMRVRGLEPPRDYLPPGPQPGASANSATPAIRSPLRPDKMPACVRRSRRFLKPREHTGRQSARNAD